jgi:uncharacterized membrane protein
MENAMGVLPARRDVFRRQAEFFTCGFAGKKATQRHTAFLSAIAALALLTGFLGVAKADGDWTVCNRIAEKANIVIAYIGHDGGFVSKGWWTLRACGGCAKVLLQSQSGGLDDGFLHAQVPGGAGIVEGDHAFCVTNGNFLMNAKDPINCPATKSFRRHHIDLRKHWTTNITGRAPSGKVCID